MTLRRILPAACLPLLLALPATAQVGAAQKVSALEGGFAGALDPGDLFGWSTAALGDVDGDGVPDLAVGSFLDDDGGPAQGAVWILFMEPDGTVKSHTKISETSGGFTGDLDPADFFGTSIAALGDLDGDGVTEIAVGAYYDDDGGPDQGAVWVLFLDAAGMVKSHTKISETSGGFTGTLATEDWFGWALAPLGDLDGDGVTELAVSADGDDAGFFPGADIGAVYVLFLAADGTVKSSTKIGPSIPPFAGAVPPSSYFGSALAAVGDLDGDGVTELAVGSDGDDLFAPDAGALWILFMTATGDVKGETRIGMGDGGFAGPLAMGDQFGRACAHLGDLDGDGSPELAVAADRDDAPVPDAGAVYVLSLLPDGTVGAEFKIGDGAGGFGGPLMPGDHFGNALAGIGDLDGNGVPDLVVGAEASDDGGPDTGAVWILRLGPPEPVEYCFGEACPCGNDFKVGGCRNSTGRGAHLSASGSTSVSADDLELLAADVPALKNGLFLMGGAASALPFKDGTLCIASGGVGIKRFPAQKSTAAGTMTQGPGIATLKAGLVVPGSTWFFQAWFRDKAGPCGTGSNFSNGVEVTFAP